MKSWNALSETDLGVAFLQAKGGVEFLPDNAQALVDSVRAWLRRSKLDHRLGDAVDIAIEVHEIYRQIRAQRPNQDDEAAFRANIHEGTTADDAALQRAEELALAGQVSQMSAEDFAANRERFGLSRSVFAHLSGE